jgi:hypothetical protein
MYAWQVYRARARLSRTPFGLEREAAYQQQNSAVAMLLVVSALIGALYVSTQVIIPNADVFLPATTTPAIPPTPTPIQGGRPVVVDSSGCENENVTLTKPANGDRMVGAFEVLGTANIPDFAFFKLEISGVGTQGAWASVEVGNEPITNSALGTFDSSLYPPGDYALRLVVIDAAGNAPPPCVVAITIAAPALAP